MFGRAVILATCFTFCFYILDFYKPRYHGWWDIRFGDSELVLVTSSRGDMPPGVSEGESETDYYLTIANSDALDASFTTSLLYLPILLSYFYVNAFY